MLITNVYRIEVLYNKSEYMNTERMDKQGLHNQKYFK